MDFEALHSANFKLLDDTVTDWTSVITKLKELEKDAREGLRGKAIKANWAGYNATVSREFIGKTAGEFADAHTQATSIRDIMTDTRDELKTQQRLLKEAIERGRGKHLTVTAKGDAFTVEENPDSKSSTGEKDVVELRNELQGILNKATEIDSTATTSLKALVDLTDYGFSGQVYKDRDSAVAALKEAERLAALAKKKPEDLSVKEFDALNAGLKKYANDALFAEHFALEMGARGTLDFWADISEPRLTPELNREREDQFAELQKNLSLTLANASQSDTANMADWKRQVVDLGDKWVGRNGGGPMGFQVMSNLMRWGDYDDGFLKSYGSALIATEKKLGDNGDEVPGAWNAPTFMEPDMNRTGSDSGYDPMTGFMKALSNSPDAATEFFDDTFVTKDEDHDFERDTDGNGKKGKVGLSNFQYLFEERDWPHDADAKGNDSVTGRNNMALALEAAVTGHPAGEMPTADTPPHNAEQAKLMKNIVESISEDPGRLNKYGYMSDSMGQMAAEYMPDIHRGLHPGTYHEAQLFPVAGHAASLQENDLTRFMYTVGRNPEGYAAISLGQHSYSTSLMEYHFRHPDAYVADPSFPENESLKKGIGDIAKVAGEIQGTIGAGRAYEGELEGGAKDEEYNAVIEGVSTWGGAAVGMGIGMATSPTAGPGAAIVGDLAGTAAGEIISSLTEGAMKDSSGEVIYRNGQELDGTKESTYTLVEKAAQKAAERAGNPSPHIVSFVATEAEAGFNNAKTNVGDYLQGEGLPKQLDKEG
ncbi:hypothetical protein ACFO9E_31705 [Streptomyces maoxianensis]|uniref:WXG100 family type VII secretion target n=1 Tax=Streptomyces maoxianensis TaxID=1459942 RepID=A0ABV9GFJ4_9ACTN